GPQLSSAVPESGAAGAASAGGVGSAGASAGVAAAASGSAGGAGSAGASAGVAAAASASAATTFVSAVSKASAVSAAGFSTGLAADFAPDFFAAGFFFAGDLRAPGERGFAAAGRASRCTSLRRFARARRRFRLIVLLYCFPMKIRVLIRQSAGRATCQPPRPGQG